MRFSKISVFVVLLSSTAFGQPRNHWVSVFDHNHMNDYLYDVYARADGGFAMCGMGIDSAGRAGFWLVKASRAGGLEWQQTYYRGDNNEEDRAFTLIEADDGGFALGGRSGPPGRLPNDFAVLRTDRDGARNWFRIYANAQFNRGACRAIIEAKNGNLLAVGEAGISNLGYAVMLNGNGDIVWERYYDRGPFNATREIADAGVIFAGPGRMVRVDGNGEMIWERSYRNSYFQDMTSCSGQGFALASLVTDTSLVITRVDNEGEVLWTSHKDIDHVQFSNTAAYRTGIARLPDGGFVVVSAFQRSDNVNVTSPVIWQTDSEGREMWLRIDRNAPAPGTLEEYNSVVVAHDGAIVATGHTYTHENASDGILVRLIPERFAPEIIQWSPDSLHLMALQEDRTEFWVSAIDLQDDSLRYSWTLDDEAVATDSLTLIELPELGEHIVKCLVSDVDLSDSILWHVSVTDLFIASHSPDTLSIAVKRGHSVDFALDSVRATPGDSISYAWTATNLNNQEREDAGRDAHATIQFDHTGNFGVEGLAFRGEARDNVVWTVAVRSAILDYWPSRLSLTFPPDTIVHFGVIPFNADSGAVHYEWRFDQDLLGMDTSEVALNFGEVGDYQVGVIVTDSTEADTDLAPKKWTRS